jgi:hypothetical protein
MHHNEEEAKHRRGEETFVQVATHG